MTARIIEIRRAQKESDYADAKALILAYTAWLGFDLSFQNFDHEMITLPDMYGEANGGLFIAYVDGVATGVAGLRKLGDHDGEVKRMYVLPEGRGLGLGKALLEQCIADAKKLQYDSVKLDTADFMKSAIALYIGAGFTEIPAYRYNPHDHARYFELRLK